MTDEELLLRAANAADQALKITKAAWDARELPRTLADSLRHETERLHAAATELWRRSREKREMVKTET